MQKSCYAKSDIKAYLPKVGLEFLQEALRQQAVLYTKVLEFLSSCLIEIIVLGHSWMVLHFGTTVYTRIFFPLQDFRIKEVHSVYVLEESPFIKLRIPEGGFSSSVTIFLLFSFHISLANWTLHFTRKNQLDICLLSILFPLLQ